MNALTYLLQVNIYLVLFLGFYWIALKNETFFKQNRIYLNLAGITSFLIPFFSSDWFRNLFITEKVIEVSQAVPIQMVYEPVIIQAEQSATTPADVLQIIYLTGLGVFLLRFIIQLALLRKTLQTPRGSAFSFFNRMIVDPDLTDRETIVHHEEVHIRQWHSLDVLLTEVVAIINWFNPVVYLYKKEIRHLHEFIADEEASGTNKERYALILLSNTLGVPAHHLTNSFFNQSLLKRRIYMLSKNRSQRTKLLKYGLLVPLFFGMLILSTAAVSRPDTFKLPDLLENERYPIDKTIDSPDFATLTKHMARTIKYPVKAKENLAEGFVLVTFKVNNETITDIEANNEVEYGFKEEVLKSLNSFQEIKVDQKRYSLLVTFQIAGSKTEFKLPKEDMIRGTQYIGEVNVTAYGSNTQSPPPPPVEKKSSVQGIINDTIPTLKELTLQLREVVISNNDKEMETVGNIQDKALSFEQVDQLPKFPGGDKGFGRFLSETIKYPAEAKENNISGRVIVSFVVEKDGALNDIKVLRGLGYGTDEEAVRVLKASPKWNPGLKDGKPVRVQYTMPIFYQMSAASQFEVLKASRLVVADGKILTEAEVQNFDAKKIQEIKVLQPAEAQKQFGEKGKNGAILITTKKN
ncbi:MAG TPA: M56 family metallopeptidase [Sphingobacteriaceae bacterium]